MKLTKQTIKFDTALLRRGDIVALEEINSCSSNRYLVSKVSEDEILLIGINKSISITPDVADKYVIEKLNVVSSKEKAQGNANQYNTYDKTNVTKNYDSLKKSVEKAAKQSEELENKELSKEECEKKTDEYLDNVIKALKASGFNVKFV